MTVDRSRASHDLHARFRALALRQLDEPLTPADAGLLAAHLEACPLCRTVAREYAEDRRRLHALPEPVPPRDLWARTSTALDREMARRDHRATVAGLTTLAGLVTLLAVVVTQPGLTAIPKQAATATPFPVPPQAVALISRAGDQLVVYRTQVDEVCPLPYPDCPQPSPADRSTIRIQAGIDPSGLALGLGGQLLITGRDANGHAFFGLIRVPEPPQIATPTPGSTLIGGSAAPTRSTSPRPTTAHSPTPRPTPTKGRPSPSGTSAATSTTAPSETDASGLSIQPLLTDVLATGAEAAWSPDGSMLAFSARPADGSRGSDIYIWRAGDPLATPLTDDGRTTFASWVGNLILADRLAPVKADATKDGAAKDGAGAKTNAPASASPEPHRISSRDVHVVLIDPLDGTTVEVSALRGAWLPTVDPTGRFVAWWSGQLDDAAGEITPHEGQLLLGNWSSMAPRATPTRAPSATISPADGNRHVDGIGLDVDGTDFRGAAGTPSPTAGASPTASTIPTASPLPTAPPLPSPLLLSPRGRTVSDWQIRWEDDGTAYGLWLPGPQDDGNGTLTVIATPTRPGKAGEVLLEPTSARRDAFAMGRDRVAWVAAVGSDGGELRLATWGPAGIGSLRVQVLDTSQGVPAF